MASAPQILKIITFSLAGTDFSDDVLDVEVVPTPGDIQAVTTLDGVTHQDIAAESWGLRIRAVIDWDTTRPGLASYLFSNKGTTVAFLFRDTTGAISTTKPGIGGNVRLVPISYGGTGNEYAEAEVVLPIDGDPVTDTTP
jgi:hypothetical protein